ncbi:hypothetical protein O1611_g2800 [Lasiodiplodia mahajangana]|uniref:Uncharacterized protein n=1 Tax=Lasiodiplodia mahajangana TaxID=1108764 RepID=A0ACC2JU91_9PEZI|nr:hypothetical protein O1611_g2800 [Lasiodiplodia mahajangana]
MRTSTTAAHFNTQKPQENVCPIQLPEPAARHPPPHLHERIRPQPVPDDTRSQQARGDGNLLEGRTDRRAVESIYKSMLRVHGGTMSIAHPFCKGILTPD